MKTVRDIAQPGLARLTGGQKVRSSNLRIPTIFLPQMGKKHEAVRLRFMHLRCASYILMLDEQSSQAQNVLHTFVCLTRLRRARHKVLHKSLTMKQLPSSFHYAATGHFIPI